MGRTKPNVRPAGKRTRLAGLVLVLAASAALLMLHRGPNDLLREARQVWRSDPSRAEVLLQRSIELSGGDFPEAQLLRCRVLGILGQWQESLGCFATVEKAAKNCDPQTLLELSHEARAAGQELLVKLALEAANRPGPWQVEVLKALVLTEQSGASPETLLDHCRQLKSLAPTGPLPWEVEARLHRRRKEVRPAIEAYRQALRWEVDERTAQVLRSEWVGLLIDSGDLNEARAVMDRLLAAAAVSPEVRTKNAYLLRLEGHTAEALAAIEEISREAPSAAAGMLRGILYLDLGRYGEAAADLERVLAEQPANKEAHYKLSQAYFKLGRREKAQRHLEESQRLTRLAVEALSPEQAPVEALSPEQAP